MDVRLVFASTLTSMAGPRDWWSAIRRLGTSGVAWSTGMASAQRDAWGAGGWGMAAEAAKSLRAVAGAEARTTWAYSRGFQISA
jgi:hypothetical protein